MSNLPQTSRTSLNLAVDATIFLAFLAAMAPRFSGLAIHEWLGIAFGAAIVTHLLLHWQWIAAVTRRLFAAAAWSARVNYGLNALLFIAVTVIVFTGLMISEEALPVFGITLSSGGVWRRLHALAADLAVFLTGLHLALHWSWIVGAVRRLLARRGSERLAAQPIPTQEA